jgi:hypothetical protein
MASGKPEVPRHRTSAIAPKRNARALLTNGVAVGLASDCIQGKFVCLIRRVAVAGSGNRFPNANVTDTRSERSSKFFDRRLIHFNLEPSPLRIITYEESSPHRQPQRALPRDLVGLAQ